MGKGVCGFESSVCSARPACPVKFVNTKSGAHFTGVGPGDGTGVRDKRFSNVRAFGISILFQ